MMAESKAARKYRKKDKDTELTGRRKAAARKRKTVSEECRETGFQQCSKCDDKECGDNLSG